MGKWRAPSPSHICNKCMGHIGSHRFPFTNTCNIVTVVLFSHPNQRSFTEFVCVAHLSLVCLSVTSTQQNDQCLSIVVYWLARGYISDTQTHTHRHIHTPWSTFNTYNRFPVFVKCCPHSTFHIHVLFQYYQLFLQTHAHTHVLSLLWTLLLSAHYTLN